MACGRPAAWLLVVFLSAGCGSPSSPVTLGDTQPLTGTDDLSARMLEGLHDFLDRRISAVTDYRRRTWPHDFSSPAAYQASIEPNRKRLRERIGVVDDRLEPSMERFGNDEARGLVAETPNMRVYQVRWPVLTGVSGEGLLLEPTSRVVGLVIALGDADQTPEMLVGLAPGVPPASQFPRRLAENGFLVVVPTLVDRTSGASGRAGRMTNQPHREWIYRQAAIMGRHIIGYETQKVLSVADWFERDRQSAGRMAVAGYGEGGLIALMAAAVDSRFDAVMVSGYFDDRRHVWREPLYRSIWGQLPEFSDSEVAALVMPRALIVEHSRGPAVAGPPAPADGVRDAAAPGAIVPPEFGTVAAEFDHLTELTGHRFGPRLVAGPNGSAVPTGSEPAVRALAGSLAVNRPMPISGAAPADRRARFDARARQHRQVRQIEGHVQALIAASGYQRDEFFRDRLVPRSSVASGGAESDVMVSAFAESVQEFREYFGREIIGLLDDDLLAPSPRSRVIHDTPAWTGHEVVLDVLPGVFARGILLVPKDLEAPERRPVVVAQHGLDALPEDVIAGDSPIYGNFGARLAERGFVVFAPHNFYRGSDSFRWVDKKAKTIKLTMFSFIVAQHRQILRWLASLPFVDAGRIGFYGLSYGGAAALIVPPLLDGYALSICSANFNDDIHKLTATDRGYSYMYTRSWEVPFFNLGNTFGHAERAYLMAPRPFMVERGHYDGVGLDRSVAAEYAKVRRLYTMLGIADRTAIEFFPGGHTINGEGTFAFLHKHLAWPVRR